MESSTNDMAFASTVSNRGRRLVGGLQLQEISLPRSMLRKIGVGYREPALIAREQLGRLQQRLEHVIQIVNQARQSQVGGRCVRRGIFSGNGRSLSDFPQCTKKLGERHAAASAPRMVDGPSAAQRRHCKRHGDAMIARRIDLRARNSGGREYGNRPECW